MMNVTHKASRFNGSFQEAQIADGGDIGEEGLFEMVCIHD